MPDRVGSCVFSSRRKDGEDLDPDGPLTRHIHVNYKDLADLFHLPLKDAAREIGLCQTTFKKACRHLKIERWPYAAVRTQPKEPAAPESLLQQASMPLDTRSFGEARGPAFQHDSFGAGFSHEGLLQPAPMALDTRSYCQSRHAGPETFAPLDAPSYPGAGYDGSHQGAGGASMRGRAFTGVPLPMPDQPMPDALPTTGPWGVGAVPLGDGPASGQGAWRLATERATTGPPRERSCVDAVMDYLDGPSASSHLASLLGSEAPLNPGVPRS